MTNKTGLKHRIILIATIIVVNVSGYMYVYFKGIEDGIIIYKKSRAFMKTLESQYNFGLRDGIRWYY